MDFNATLNECVKSLPFIDRLKDQQRLAIVSLLQGKDVVCIGPFHLLSAPPLLRVFKKYPLDIALVIGYVDFSF